MLFWRFYDEKWGWLYHHEKAWVINWTSNFLSSNPHVSSLISLFLLLIWGGRGVYVAISWVYVLRASWGCAWFIAGCDKILCLWCRIYQINSHGWCHLWWHLIFRVCFLIVRPCSSQVSNVFPLFALFLRLSSMLICFLPVLPWSSMFLPGRACFSCFPPVVPVDPVLKQRGPNGLLNIWLSMSLS